MELLLLHAVADALGDGVTCNPHNGGWLDDVEPGRRVDLLFLVKPNFAPIFFQLFPEIARCNVLGDVLYVKSEVGGVVGGVIGSAEDECGLLLSSVIMSTSTVSIEAVVDRFPAPLLRLPMINIGR